MCIFLFSLLESGKGCVKVKDVEKSLDGNICRCTGYRPILDAFKSLAIDASDDLRRKCDDIEVVKFKLQEFAIAFSSNLMSLFLGLCIMSMSYASR